MNHEAHTKVKGKFEAYLISLNDLKFRAEQSSLRGNFAFVTEFAPE